MNKVCSSCKDNINIVHFHKNACRKDGYHNYCKPCRKLQKKDRQQERLSSKKYRDKNPGKIKEMSQAYYIANRSKVIASNVMQYCRRKNRVPKWLTKDDLLRISWFYDEATRLTALTGILYEVDHIIPLQGKNVSGLHVPLNLQVIPRSENRSKSNKYTQGDIL